MAANRGYNRPLKLIIKVTACLPNERDTPQKAAPLGVCRRAQVVKL